LWKANLPLELIVEKQVLELPISESGENAWWKNARTMEGGSSGGIYCRCLEIQSCFNVPSPDLQILIFP
jgi:hypothetical protein